jgi:hypothetical protein
MCFSAEASFAAALALGVIGGMTLKNHLTNSHFFLAAIPLLFAIQQLSEGFVWLHLSQNIGSEAMFLNAQRIFLSFAFLIWPIWTPLSFALIEPVPWRKFLLYLNLVSGFALFLLYLSYSVNQNPSVQVVHHSLQYFGRSSSREMNYLLIVILPCFLSSLRGAWIFGLFVIVAYFSAIYFYETTFISVWCFFAAIVSLSVYKILKDNQFSIEKNHS